MRFGIRAPLWRRESLTRRFLAHYGGMKADLRESGIDLVLVAVSSQGPKYVDRVRPTVGDWRFVEYPNNPRTLGLKMRASLHKLRELEVDCALNLGSDDFVSILTIRRLAQLMGEGYDFIGFSDFYYAHAHHGMRHWPGYPRGSRRSGEPIGAGRTYSARLLDALDWDLWPGGRLHALDANSWGRVKALNSEFKVRTMPSRHIGPMVDVKGAESVTPWKRLGAQNVPVPIGKARKILEEVGLGGML